MHHFEGQRYHLIAFVVLNDHVHAMIRPIGDWRLEDIVHTLRSYSAHEIARGRGGGRIWQDEYLDRVVRDENEMNEKFVYILNNPFKRWPEIDSYEWVWSPQD
ncbi:MAG: transposase [Candidatus Binataceae bacterium]